MKYPRIGKLEDPLDEVGERHQCSECGVFLRKGQKVLMEEGLFGYSYQISYSCMKCTPEIVDSTIYQLEHDFKKKFRSYIKIREKLSK